MKNLHSQHFRQISLASHSLRITEGDIDTPNAVFQVRLNKAAHVPITVEHGTLPGRAYSGEDYGFPDRGILNFPPSARRRKLFPFPFWTTP